MFKKQKGSTKKNYSRGYTFIELMVVLVIIILLFLVSLPLYGRARANNELKQATEEIKKSVDTAVAISQSPSKDDYMSRGTCIIYEKGDQPRYKIAVINNNESSDDCTKAKAVNSGTISSNCILSCNNCTIVIPANTTLANDTEERVISLKLIRDKSDLSKIITINNFGIVNVK